MVDWPVEHIPDGCAVLMRAHQQYFSREGNLQPGVFRVHGSGMSVDWGKYSSPENTRDRASNNPHKNAVIRMLVLGIRQMPSLDVKHTPEPDNRSHSDVLGIPSAPEDRTEIRMILLGLSEVVLPFPVDDPE